MKLMRRLAASLSLIAACAPAPRPSLPASPRAPEYAANRAPAAPVPTAPRTAGEVVRGPLGRQLDEALSRYQDYGLSGSFLVAHAGELVLHKGYGICDPSRRARCRPDTLFDVGSISKQLTAAAIMRLQDEGKLSVDETVGRYLPELEGDKAALTLHQLLTHTSGLDEDISRYPAGDRDAFLAGVNDHPMAATPGAQFIYSNAGYSLLAEVVERASRQPYAEVIAALARRAGMRSTRFVSQSDAPPRDAAKPQRGSAGELSDAPRIPWYVRGAGGVHSTLPDLLRWVGAVEGDLLSAEARARLFTPALEGYAYGWHVDQTPLGVVRWHGGMIFGQHAMLRRYVQDDVIVIHVINQHSGWGRLIDGLFDDLIGERARPLPPPAVAARPAGLDGQYRLEGGGRLVLRERPRGWLVEALDDETYALVARPADHDAWPRIAPLAGPARERTRRALGWLVQGDLAQLQAALPPKSNQGAADVARRWRATVLATGLAASRLAGSGLGAEQTAYKLAGALPLPSAVRVVVAIDGPLDSRYVAFDWHGDTLVGMTVLTPMAPRALAVATGEREIGWLTRDGSFVRATLRGNGLSIRVPTAPTPLLAARQGAAATRGVGSRVESIPSDSVGVSEGN